MTVMAGASGCSIEKILLAVAIRYELSWVARRTMFACVSGDKGDTIPEGFKPSGLRVSFS